MCDMTVVGGLLSMLRQLGSLGPLECCHMSRRTDGVVVGRLLPCMLCMLRKATCTGNMSLSAIINQSGMTHLRAFA